MRVHVITISDRAAAGEYEDKSGAEIERLLREAFPECAVTRELVPDGVDGIRFALARACGLRIDGTRPCDCVYAYICTKTEDCRPGQAATEYGPAGGRPDFILTTGGTGISPRDVTPEVTMSFCDKALFGIAEALRAASLAETKSAMLSRAYAGVCEKTIIVNFPGSVRACTLCTQTLIPVMEHAVAMINGEGHGNA